MTPLESRRLLSVAAHAQDNDLAYDSTGRLHFAYYDATAQSLKYAVQGLSGQWSSTTTIDAAGDVGRYVSLAIDPDGNPGVAYFDANSADLKYAHLSNGQWEIQRVDGNGRVGLYASLAYRADGAAVIGYYDKTRGDARVAEWRAPAWTIRTIDAAGDVGRHASLQIDPFTQKWIVGYERTSDGAVLVARLKSYGVLRKVISKAPRGAAYLSMAIAPDGLPAFSYHQATARDLRFASFDGTTWQPTIVSSPGVQGIGSKLLFDTGGQATIVHYNETSDSIDQATRAGASWLPAQLTAGGNSFVSAAQFNDEPIVLGVPDPGDDQLVIGQLPEVPTGVTASVPSDSAVDISWASGAVGADSFLVERSLDGQSWTPAGQVAAPATQFTDTTVVEGTAYSYRVRAAGAIGSSAPSNVVAATTWPAAPSGLAATSISASRIDLTWNENSAAETNVIVERSEDGTNFAEIAFLPADATSHSVTGLDEASVYSFRVRAAIDGLQSAASASASAITRPAAPSALAATAVTDGRIDLSWTDNSAGETGIVVSRSIDGVSFVDIAMLGANSVDHEDTGLDEATEYTYRVRAISAAGDSGSSNSAACATLPAAPSLLGTLVVSATQINLAWTDNSAGEQGFIIERSDAGGPWVDVAIVSSNVTSHSDTTVSEATGYAFRVRAFNGSGDSPRSNSASSTTTPAAPSSLAATTVSATQINLTWTDHSAGEDGFIVSRSDDGTVFTDIAILPANTSAHADVTVAEATEYSYRIRAFNASGDSAVPSAASATTLPAAASALTATPMAATQIDLSWSDNSGGESGYEVERSADGSTWMQVAVLPANASAYSDTSAPDASTSYYRVRAASPAGASAYSGSASATTVPLAPASVSANAVSLSQIDLAWDDVNGNTGYEIERSTDGVSYSPVATMAAGETTHSDATVAEGVSYQYRIRAAGAAGYSAYSSAAGATTPGSTSGTIHAHFSDGNGTTSSDQFAGVAADGWSNAWQANASTSTLVTTVKSFGDSGYSPVNARGKYLDVNAAQVGGGAANPRVGRQYTAFGGVTLTATHVIRFDLRVDTLGTFTNANDRITIVDTTVLTTGGTASSTWEIRAYGAAAGTAAAGKWSFYNGIRNGEGSANNNRWVSSTMNVVAGTTYSFTITTNPVTRSWDVAITASDGQTAVNSTNLGYRTTATTARGFVSYSVRTNANSEARDISIDSMTVDLT